MLDGGDLCFLMVLWLDVACFVFVAWDQKNLVFVRASSVNTFGRGSVETYKHQT